MSIVRSLGRRGVEVIAADSNRRSPGFVSRHARGRVVYPRPSTDGAAVVDTLLRAVEKYEVDLVVPVGEDLVVLLSNARDRFAGAATLALPAADALAVARDKLATVELAERLGVPTPRTALVESASEAVAAVADFEWPVVLKPRASRAIKGGGEVEPFGVSYAADLAELRERMGRLEGRSGALLQEYWAGEGHGVGLLLDRGQPLLAFQHRRLREVPITGGPSSFRESVALDPDLLDFSVRILGALEWTGPAMVEFKLGADGPKLMEINGRLWGSLALAVKSGVDLPGRLVDLFLSPSPGPPAPAQLDYRAGVRSRDLPLELNWIGSVLVRRTPYTFLDLPRRREAFAAAVSLLDPRLGFDVLSLRDPRPGLAELGGIAGGLPALARRAYRSLRGLPRR